MLINEDAYECTCLEWARRRGLLDGELERVPIDPDCELHGYLSHVFYPEDDDDSGLDLQSVYERTREHMREWLAGEYTHPGEDDEDDEAPAGDAARPEPGYRDENR